MRSYYKSLFTTAALTLALLICIPAVAQGPSDLTVLGPDTKRSCPTDGGPGQ